MGKLTAEEANKELEDLVSDKNLSLKDKENKLRQIIENLDVSTHGNTTVLYSGPIEPGARGTGELVKEFKNNANIRLLDNTEAYKFLNLETDGNKTLRNALGLFTIHS